MSRPSAFEENCFDLPPGASKSVRILSPGGGRRLTVKAPDADAIKVN